MTWGEGKGSTPHDAVANHRCKRHPARAEVGEPGAAARSRLLQVYENGDAALAAAQHLVSVARLLGTEPVVVQTVPYNSVSCVPPPPPWRRHDNALLRRAVAHALHRLERVHRAASDLRQPRAYRGDARVTPRHAA